MCSGSSSSSSSCGSSISTHITCHWCMQVQAVH
jgi:hypothetical protein